MTFFYDFFPLCHPLALPFQDILHLFVLNLGCDIGDTLPSQNVTGAPALNFHICLGVALQSLKVKILKQVPTLL